MSLNYVEVKLDKERKLRYRIVDLRDLCQRLGGITILELLARMGGLDPQAIITALLMGLRWEDRGLTPQRVEDLMQAHVDAGGTLGELINQINEALERSGVVRRREEGADTGGEKTPGSPP